MGVEKSVRKDENLTIFVVQGNVAGDEISKAVEEFYSLGPITKNVLWDLSQAELKNLHEEDVRRIVHVPRKSLELRDGGKTAIVAPGDLEYGLSRMYQFSAATKEFPFEQQVFRELQAAEQWLQEDSSPID